MPSSEPNYRELYKLQDSVLASLAGGFGVFHLTGGTALGRFYLNHRFSEDLDLFTNQDPGFLQSANRVRKKLKKDFTTSDDKILLSDDFIRIWIPGKQELKIEMVNDVAERWGNPIFAGTTPVDTVGNILANKLTAIVGRDEPKDIFDIVSIATGFSFNWGDVFVSVLQKAIVSEVDVLMRITSFPVELMEGQNWLKNAVNPESFKEKLKRIGDDFLLAGDNTLGVGKTPITEAVPKRS